jgi:hypothetical protein
MASMNALNTKREGDISDAFASMSGKKAEPLPDRFRQLKLSLTAGNEDQIVAGWRRLLKVLKYENDVIAQKGPSIIPDVRFTHLDQDLAAKKEDIVKRGAAVIRGVIPEKEARDYKFEIEEYVRRNPQTKGEYLAPISSFPIWTTDHKQAFLGKIHRSLSSTGPGRRCRPVRTPISSLCRPSS